MKASVTVGWDSQYYLQTIDSTGNSGRILILPTSLIYAHELPKTVKRQAEKLANVLVLNELWLTAFSIACSLDSHRNPYVVDFIVQEYKAGRMSYTDLYTLPLRFETRYQVCKELGI